MKTELDEAKDSIVEEVYGSSVVVSDRYYMYTWMVILCVIYRVEANIQFSYVLFKSNDEKGGYV